MNTLSPPPFPPKPQRAGPSSPHHWGLPEFHLAPGEVVVTRDARCVSTILGSCVAVFLHVPRQKLSAICHGVLPNVPGCIQVGHSQRLRFLDAALPEMADWLIAQKVSVHEIQAKLFGGAHVLSTGEKAEQFQVGARNIEMAERWLHACGIRLDARCVGGTQGRKLHFNTHTGEVLLRSMNIERPKP